MKWSVTRVSCHVISNFVILRLFIWREFHPGRLPLVQVPFSRNLLSRVVQSLAHSKKFGAHSSHLFQFYIKKITAIVRNKYFVTFITYTLKFIYSSGLVDEGEISRKPFWGYSSVPVREIRWLTRGGWFFRFWPLLLVFSISRNTWNEYKLKQLMILSPCWFIPTRNMSNLWKIQFKNASDQVNSLSFRFTMCTILLVFCASLPGCLHFTG